MTLALLFACGPSVPADWTRDGAFAGALAAMDHDGDGGVDAADYARVQVSGPPFATVDTDGDGRLSTHELQALVYAVDPLAFDANAARRAPTSASVRASFPRPWWQRMAAERSLFTRELEAAGASVPGWPPPSDAAERR